MPYAVQLDVDHDTQAALDEIDQRLAAAGLRRTIRQLAAVHHVALGVYADLPPHVDSALAEFAATTGPISLRLSSVGIFPGLQGVLFLAPVVTEELLAVHRRFQHALSGAAEQNDPYYRKDMWVPHVTLALDVPALEMPAAVAVASDRWRPRDVIVDHLRLTRFEPVVTRRLYPLAG